MVVRIVQCTWHAALILLMVRFMTGTQQYGIVRTACSVKRHDVLYGHIDQPGKVANLARGQLDGENDYISLSAFAPENFGFARRVPPSSPASTCSFPTVEC